MHGITCQFDAATGIATLLLAMEGKVNKIDRAFGEGLDAALSEALASPGLKGIVLASGHADFCVGADIDMLYRSRDAAELFQSTRQLGLLYRKLETCGVPVVAALTGSALGGGYELALACHHRIALDDPKIQFGLPEVNLGVIPGAGGTQRLPRLIGVQPALEVILQGQQLRAPKAKQAGLVDALAKDPAELRTLAEAWIAANKGAKQPWDRGGWTWPGVAPGSTEGRTIFVGACAMLFKKTSGVYKAPEEAVSVIQEGARLSFDRALELEVRAFVKLAVSDQCKDMVRTLWYHRNAATRHAGLPRVERDGVRKITILGAGMMGAGLGYLCASKGYEVVLKDIRAEAVEKGLAHVRQQVAERNRHLDEAGRAAILARVTGTVDYEAVRGSDLVIEAVLEDLAVKHRVIREVEPLLAPNAIFASNTSALPISDLAQASAHPERFIGLHYFSPVEQMPLVEIIRGKGTDEETVARCLAFSKVVGKLPIVVNDGYGFYTTRVFSAYILEAAQLVAEGHDPVLVEWAARSAGMAVPPLQVFDEVTLRLARHAMDQARHYRADLPEIAGIRLVRALVDEHGRVGRVEGKGFYDYADGKRQGFWPGLRALVGGPPAKTGVPYLQDRLLYAQIAEVARAWEDGVLRERRDAEVGAIFGIGFAPNTGGPLSFMDRRGLGRVVAELDQLAAESGERYLPAPVLRRMAALGESWFGSWSP